jgi:hypothetical protein
MGLKPIVLKGITVSQMAAAEGVSRHAIETRLSRRKVKPIISEFLYSLETYELIKGVKRGGSRR